MGYIGQGDAAAHASAGLVLDIHYVKADGSNPGSGTLATWTDLSGNGNSATLKNFGYTTSSGWGANGLIFDNVDDYLLVSNKTALNPTTAFTIESWIKPNVLSEEYICRKGPTTDNITSGYSLLYVSSGLYFRVSNGTRTQLEVSHGMSVGQIYCIQAVYDGSNLYVYINNSLRGSIACNITITSNTNALTIGSSNTYGCMGGDMLIYRQYNRALTSDERTQNWNIGTTFPSDTLTPTYYSYIIAP